MKNHKLDWQLVERDLVFKTRQYSIQRQKEISPKEEEGIYYCLDAPVWVVVLAKEDDNFIMVRQYRHGLKGISLEFPGGCHEENEDYQQTASRELEEETGYKADKFTLLGQCNPNPALFSNKVYFYLAEQLEATDIQHPDSDEYINVHKIGIKTLLEAYGQGELCHGFIGTGLFFYLRYLENEKRI